MQLFVEVRYVTIGAVCLELTSLMTLSACALLSYLIDAVQIEDTRRSRDGSPDHERTFWLVVLISKAFPRFDFAEHRQEI
jgi:hypothetical protein